MDPLKYRRPVFVNPPFRDALDAALARHLGEAEVGTAYRVLPLLDGTHDIADIYGRLAIEGISPALVSRALDALDGLGSLSDTPPDDNQQSLAPELSRYRNQLAYLEEWLRVRQGTEDAGKGASAAQAALGTARVVVMGLGRTGAALIEALSLAGVGHLFGMRSGETEGLEEQMAALLPSRVAALNPRSAFNEISSVDGGELFELDRDGGAPLLVYCPDEFHETVCEQLNSIALSTGASLLPYRETPFSVELGPLVIPGRTACYNCYQLRRKAAEPKPGPEDDQPGETDTQAAALNFSPGAHLLALEIVKIVTRAAFPVSRGKLWRLGLFDGSVSVHPVLKLPRCPVCGTHRRTPPRRIWEE